MSEVAEEQEQSEETSSQESALSDLARNAIEELVAGILREDQVTRRAEVRRAWQQRLFKDGIQFLWYNSTTYCFSAPSASGEELPPYMDVYNIYTPHWRSFVSILSQNPPGINFVPDDLQDGKDVTAATYAEKMRSRVDRIVCMKDRQMEVAGLFCTDGRTIARTYIDEDGKLAVRIYGVLESKTPIFVRKMKNWGYCVLSEEVDLYEAKDDYPDFADDIDSSAAGQADYERYARLNVLADRKGAYGDGIKTVATKHLAWVRPSRYRKAPKEVQEELKSKYPDGFRATIISETCVECVAETMEQALTVQWPSPSQGQVRPSMLHDAVPIQEAFNDVLNMIREHGDYSIPAKWVTDTVDDEAIAEQISAPGVVHQISVPNGASIEDLVFVEPTPTLPAELVANVDRLLSLAQFTTGDLPSLYGEDEEHQETASGQRALTDQAKGQLSPAWSGIQWLFAGVYDIAVRLLAKMSPEETAVQGEAGNEKFDPSLILEGSFGCYPDTDSSFPETTADKRASVQNMVNQLANAGPAGLSIIMQPDNLKLMKQLGGVSDFIIPGAEARDKQLEEIDQLLQETPVPDQTQLPQWMRAAQMAQAQGQPIPPPPVKPSVDIDPDWDYHQAEADKVQEWLSSRACREEMRKGNIQGIANVKLHGQAHKDALSRLAQQNAPKPEPPRISLTAQIQDPTAISQLLGEAGVQTSPENIAAAKLPEDQNQAADTQLKAASAQHKAVLAAKEAVAPIKTVSTPPSPQAPDQTAKES